MTGQGRGGRTEQVGLTYIHQPMQNRSPVGGCCGGPGLSSELRADREGWAHPAAGDGRRPRGERVDLNTADSLPCAEETNASG